MISKLDGVRYVLAYKIAQKQDGQRFKSLDLGNTHIFLIPFDIFKTPIEGYKPILFNWKIIEPVLQNITEKGWEIKFENDRDEEELEKIEDKYYLPVEKLKAIKEYFERYYVWPDAIADPIIYTRLLITPPDADNPITIYYGNSVIFGSNSNKDIKELFTLILEEYKKIYCE